MRIRFVDAFTPRPFGGNPAAVVLLPDSPAFPDDAWLQQVAAEVNLSETAYAHPLPEGTPDADWALRWFTPTTEVDMCGHATLATAHVLHTTGTATGTIRFAARCGILTATAHDDGTITLDFPTAPITPAALPDGVDRAIGAPVLSVHDTGPAVGDLVVEVAGEQTVLALSPDLPAVARLSRRGIIVTAAADDPDSGYDFVSRCFFPNAGIDEDPVTGSAHTALAPFWSARLGRTELTGRQGTTARSGLVRTALRGARTLLTGSAVTVIDGELLAAP
ncbi:MULTISPECIES: PhzF family phenazine biosynthesis protein [Streptomyces]|uniref:PhzF family phenazine biosynthesis protein n=1 Tax=Streptomyces tsukubensis (strain DSM 42081 / NBRC 108919 / NRRL 18488 / 9993) TaxID=1114943 RepID=I2MUY3_STRT9|nr:MULTISPECIES: PhzF family phenazine biosynthesis protein [Streptomyces]AZK93066.1 oxidoreductase [Streptomyces tsukubensis]EIF88580.1 oxidoreductase [Streptomyces tsukubensis NRRL18488]MYS68347.1 PhzF family phenazine biosynthesis isomerase [Streptomyces sp. SID5473]QKM70772.1 PhzF family phenazine biosynthesis protein [Streptomyces tsukubensis NRRL18488]TAI41110.1 PhzF family phenazine biosynthesis protein [Streptomyces tsukubensis]